MVTGQIVQLCGVVGFARNVSVSEHLWYFRSYIQKSFSISFAGRLFLLHDLVLYRYPKRLRSAYFGCRHGRFGSAGARNVRTRLHDTDKMLYIKNNWRFLSTYHASIWSVCIRSDRNYPSSVNQFHQLLIPFFTIPDIRCLKKYPLYFDTDERI